MGVALRLAGPADAAGIHTIYAPVVEQTGISFEFAPPSVEEMAQRVQATTVQYPWLVCEADDMVVGYAYASQHNARLAYQWAVNVSAYVHPQWRKRGVARGLYTALMSVLRAQGYYGAYAGITLPNRASVALHESVGFVPLGVYHAVGYKFGAWHDVGWWECELQPRTGEPAPPLAIGEIVANDVWHVALAAGLAAIRA